MLKKIVIIILTVLLIEVLQISFLNRVFYNGVTPDILLLVVIFLVALNGMENNFLFLVFAGLFADIFDNSMIGPNIISLVFVSLAIIIISSWLSVSQVSKKFLMMIFLVAIGTILNDIVINFLQSVVAINIELKNIFSGSLLVRHIGVNIVAAGALYWPLKKLADLKFLFCSTSNISIR